MALRSNLQTGSIIKGKRRVTLTTTFHVRLIFTFPFPKLSGGCDGPELGRRPEGKTTDGGVGYYLERRGYLAFLFGTGTEKNPTVCP